MSRTIDELAQRAFSGDAEAWRSLYELMTPRIFGLVRRLNAPVDDAVEVVQETWLRVLGKSQNYDPSRPFEPYVFTVAVNLWVDQCRSRKRSPGRVAMRDETPSHESQPEELVFAAERAERMMKCLDVLSEEERQIVVLRFWDDLTNQEIGERIGATTTSIKGKSYRAVRKLADCMHLEGFLDTPDDFASAAGSEP